MKHLVKVKFIRPELFKKYFGKDYIDKTGNYLYDVGINEITYLDQVKDNDEQNARGLVLAHIGGFLKDSKEFKNENFQISGNMNEEPNRFLIMSHDIKELRGICEIVDVSILKEK